MKSELSKTDAQEQINIFFLKIKEKSPKEIKKIKTLAMSKKISLKKFRNSFCKYCLNHFSGFEKIRIKNKRKSVGCKKCKKLSRWKIK